MSTQTNVFTIANSIAITLWANYEQSIALAAQIVDLLKATKKDLVKAGEAVGAAWNEIGGETESGIPTRLLVESCWQASLTKEETRLFIKATGLVSKQRASILTSSVFDGVSAREAKGGKKEKVNPGLTIDQIVNAIESLESLPAADAARIAKAIQAKLA